MGPKSTSSSPGTAWPPHDYDYDWTDNPDEDIWQFLTSKRYDIMREVLLDGNPVQTKSGGKSLQPLVFSGDTCFFNPILPGCNSNIGAGDLVFCRVQPNDRYYCHLVWNTFKLQTPSGVEKQCYIIGNNNEGSKAKSNGWCYREHIYGLLTRTGRGDYWPTRTEKYT